MIERNAKRDVLTLMHLYGQLSISEVKNMYPDFIGLEKDDFGKSNTRNEEHYRQTIGNMTCHQKSISAIHSNGFQLSKAKRPAILTLVKGQKTKLALNEQEIEDKRHELFKMNASEMVGKHTLDLPTEILVGIAEKFEQERLRTLFGFDEDRVYNIARDYPFIYKKYGIHLLSVNSAGDPITIFVEYATPDYQLSDEAKEFLSSRNFNGYTEDKSYIYFVSDEAVKIANAREFKGEI